MLASAARRGPATPLLVGDLRSASTRSPTSRPCARRMRIVKEARCDTVKLQRAIDTSVARARAIIEAGIPVVGHVGLTPQTATALGGYGLRGGRTTPPCASRGKPGAPGRGASRSLRGNPGGRLRRADGAHARAGDRIGAGPAADGQVIVSTTCSDPRKGRGARFVKRYADVQKEMNQGVSAYAPDGR